MALEAIASIDEFNILGYSNAASASATNVTISVELKVTHDDGTKQTLTRTNVRFIQDVWNDMAADPNGREILRQHVQELTRIRALVFAGVSAYEDFV